MSSGLSRERIGALRESEERLRILFEQAADAIWVCRPDGRIVQVNEQAWRSTGYTERELLRLNVADVDADVTTPEAFQEHFETLLPGHTDTIESRHRRKDGSTFPVEITIARLETPDGTRGLGIARDITERRRAEEALRESEARLEESNQIMTAVLDRTHMMAVLLDTNFNFIWVNRAYADTCRHESSFFPGKNHFDLYPHEENQAIFQRVVDTGEPFFVAAKPFEFPDQPERGVTYWDWSLIPVKDDIGKVTGLVFTLADVTERIRAEEALRESEETARALLNTTTDSAMLVDKNGILLALNAIAAERFGESVNRLIGTSVFDAFPPELARSRKAHMEEVLKTGKPVRLEDERAGRTYDSHIYPVLDASGEVSRIAVFAHDITERKRAEDLVRIQRDLAVSLGKSVDFHEVLRLCLRAVLEASGMDCGGVYIVDPATGALDFPYYEGLPEDFVAAVAHYEADSPNAQMVMAGDPIYTSHKELGLPLKSAEDEEDLKAIAVVPVKHAHWVVGCLNVASHTHEEVPQSARNTMETIASQIGDAIANRQAQDALRESEARFRSLFEGAAEGILVADDESKQFTFANSAVCTMLGYTEDELRRMGIEDIHPKESLDHVIAMFEAQARGERLLAPSVPCLRKDGAVLYADIRSSSVVVNERKCSVGFFTDITERKRAEEALRGSEERYRSVVEDSPGLICRHLPGGEITFVNENYCRYFGKTADELVARNFLSLVPEEDREAVMAGISALTVDSPVQTHEHKVIAPDGEIRWQRWTNRGLFDEQGRAVAFQAFGEDITERKRAEETLRRQAQIVAQVHDSVVTTDLEGCITSWNRGAERLHGYTEAEVLGESVSLAFPEEHREMFWNIVMKNLMDNDEHTVELSMLRRSGEVFHGLLSLSLLRNAQGEPVGTVGYALDITERKRAEEAMRASRGALELRNRIDRVFLTVPDENMYGEVLQIILDAVDSPYGVFGFINEDGDLITPSMTRDIWDECRMPDKTTAFPREVWGGIWGRSLHEATTLCANMPLTVPEGHVPISRALSVPIVHQETIIGIFLVGNKSEDYEERDIALLEDVAAYVAPVLNARLERTREEGERKRAEQALRESEERFRRFAVASSYGFAMGELTGQLVFANAATLRIVEEESEGAFTNKTFYQYYTPEDAEQLRREILPIVLEKGQWVGETPLLSARGNLIATEQNIFLIRDEQGAPRMVGNIITDITERTRAEEERERLQAQLRQAQKMEAVGQLAGGVAHDFNNLLTAILGNSEMLLSTVAEKAAATSEERLRPGLEQIQSAGKQASYLTRQLLAFSHREVTRPEVLDPKRVVGDMEGMLRRLIGEHIQLDVRLSAETGFILADPGQIEQVIMNLVVNAADAMPKGGRVEIRVEDAELDETCVADQPDAKPGRHVLLSVVDNGTGMTPDTLEHLFEPFFTTKPVGKGTGMGLATVYGTVKQLGGHIRVGSKPGVGSTFTFYVPVVDEKEVEKEPESEPTCLCAGETILVCEDDGMVRNVMCRTLRAAGYTVIEADNGQQALEATATHGGTIDLLVSDLIMPGMNGRELADNLAPEHPDMRVLFVSGYTADHLDDHGVRGGGAEFLQKPFGPTALLRRVREVLDAERALG